MQDPNGLDASAGGQEEGARPKPPFPLKTKKSFKKKKSKRSLLQDEDGRGVEGDDVNDSEDHRTTLVSKGGGREREGAVEDEQSVKRKKKRASRSRSSSKRLSLENLVDEYEQDDANAAASNTELTAEEKRNIFLSSSRSRPSTANSVTPERPGSSSSARPRSRSRKGRKSLKTRNSSSASLGDEEKRRSSSKAVADVIADNIDTGLDDFHSGARHYAVNVESSDEGDRGFRQGVKLDVDDFFIRQVRRDSDDTVRVGVKLDVDDFVSRQERDTRGAEEGQLHDESHDSLAVGGEDLQGFIANRIRQQEEARQKEKVEKRKERKERQKAKEGKRRDKTDDNQTPTGHQTSTAYDLKPKRRDKTEANQTRTGPQTSAAFDLKPFALDESLLYSSDASVVLEPYTTAPAPWFPAPSPSPPRQTKRSKRSRSKPAPFDNRVHPTDSEETDDKVFVVPSSKIRKSERGDLSNSTTTNQKLRNSGEDLTADSDPERGSEMAGRKPPHFDVGGGESSDDEGVGRGAQPKPRIRRNVVSGGSRNEHSIHFEITLV